MTLASGAGLHADKKTRPDMAFATPDVFFFHFYTAALCFGQLPYASASVGGLILMLPLPGAY
jgi:hypothetical protein